MNWLLVLWINFIGWLFGRKSVEQPAYILTVVEGAFPGRLDERTVYVLTEDGDPWQAKIICPCGCKAELDLNMLTDERPCWQAWADGSGRATLRPSVWRRIDCQSHFILKDGMIIWCREDDVGFNFGHR